ncbi:MAG TPA: SDR family NAD(P)-dependent oxidoreductase [Actinomycetota bacterium]|nr:SDR family NAD(P)-dependent oxidoreductase [Actinomycetota bacterium]
MTTEIERGRGRLAGKVAVVVGAGQTPGETIGNGRATAIRFAQEGARLLLVDRDDASLKETHESVVDAGAEAHTLVTDIVLPDAPAAIVEAAIGTFGRIDILHNNVGVGMGDSSPTRLTEEVWDRIFDVNLKAMWRVCKQVIPVMRKQGSGSIVCVSSIAAICAAGHITAYKISKAGVNALVHQLAMTNARHGIRVNGIMPGFIDTPMAVDAVAEVLEMSREDLANVRAQMVPLENRQGTAWDVANAALFLASDEASFVTGALLPVDGGQSAKIG